MILTKVFCPDIGQWNRAKGARLMISTQRSKASATILIAEGDPMIREFFTSTLANRGYTIDVVTDGLETTGRLEALL